MHKETKRKSNIELLRALLMFMVIILHYNNAEMGGGFAAANGASLQILKWMETLSVCAVNCFVLISAYFMSTNSNRTLRKPLHLLGMVSGYQILSYVLQILVSKTAVFQIRTLIVSAVPMNWFVTFFCVLYLISPYINPLFEALTKQQLQKCIGTCLALFVLYPTILEGGLSYLTGSSEWAGLGTVTMTGSAGGYTIVNFVIMYLIGGYLRKYPVRFSQRQCLAGFILASVVDYGISMFSSVYTSYANIFVVLQAVTLFLVFQKWDMKSYSVINFIAKSAFGIYLLHTSLFMVRDFWGHFHIAEYVQKAPGIVLGHMLISCIAMYMVCLIIDIVCRSIVTPMVNKIEGLLLR